jgi:mannose-6-phosphate isomerase-like protein (cupin superfamily)
MTAAPGSEDQPHEHPSHSMYFVTSCKLEIKDGPPDAQGEAHVAEVPAGAAPIFPAGPHQVKNIGDADAKVIFVESFPLCKPCGLAEGFTTPFTTTPECYKVLAENDDWITGELTMEVGQADSLHDHLDHLIYVLEGDEVTIYPMGVLGDGHAVPIKPGAGLAAPMSAGPIFAKHSMKNTGTVPLKMIFFEMKK